MSAPVIVSDWLNVYKKEALKLLLRVTVTVAVHATLSQLIPLVFSVVFAAIVRVLPVAVTVPAVYVNVPVL